MRKGAVVNNRVIAQADEVHMEARTRLRENPSDYDAADLLSLSDPSFSHSTISRGVGAVQHS